MSVAILLLTHEEMGAALITTAHHILGRMALVVEAHAIPPGSDADAALHEAAALAAQEPSVRRVSGLNLPMLLRVLNYAEQSLPELAQTAAQGGRAGIRIDDA
jgi:PTS system ascorbate-specific IIA component